MLDSARIRDALGTWSDQDRQLLDIARWAQESGEFDDDTLSVFVAPAFLELRLAQRDGLAALLNDFEILAEQAPHCAQFRLIGNALRLAAGVLARAPDQLATQLLARLPEVADGPLGALLDNLKLEYPRIFQPIRSSLVKAEQAFLVKPVADASLEGMTSSPDGGMVAVRDARGRVHLLTLQARRLKLVATIACPGVHALAFTPSGRRLIAASTDGVLTVIDPRSRTRIGGSRVAREVHAIVAIDEDRIAVDHGDGATIVGISDGRELVRIGEAEQLAGVTALVVAPGQGLVITGGFEGRVDAWSAADGTLVRRIGWFGGFGAPRIGRTEASAATVIGGMTLLAADGTAISMDTVLAGQPELLERLGNIRRSDPLRHMITVLHASPDGRLVIARDRDGGLRAWSSDAPDRHAWFDRHGIVASCVAIAPDGDRVITVEDAGIRVWSLSRQAAIGRLPGRGSKLHTVDCPPRADVVLGAHEDGTITVWGLDAFTHAPEPSDRADTTVGFGPPEHERLRTIARSGRVAEWDLRTGTELQALPLAASPARRLCVSGGGRRTAAWTGDGVEVFDVATRLPLYHCPFVDPGESGSLSLAVSEDGKRVVVAWNRKRMSAFLAADEQVELLDMPSGTRTTLSSNAGLVDELVISPDGRFAVCSSSTRNTPHGMLQSWDLDTGSELPLTSLHPEHSPHGFTFGPDSETLVWCQQQSLRQWRPFGGEPPVELLRTDSSWRRATLAPNGRYAAAIVEHGRLELWDLADHTRVAAFDADHALVCCTIVVEHDAVVVADESPGLHFLRFPFPRTPRDAAARPAATDEPTRSLEAIVELERQGRAGEALEARANLARSAIHPAPLRVALAPLLLRSGRVGEARIVLHGLLSGTDPIVRRRAFDALLALAERHDVTEVLRRDFGAELPDPGTIEILRDAAAWLVSRGEREALERIARGPAPALGRLIAAHHLVELDEAASASCLARLAEDSAAAAVDRTIAWESLLTLIPAPEWLERVAHHVAREHWPAALLRRLGRAVLRTLEASQVFELYPNPDDAHSPIEPLSTPWQLNERAIGLANRRQYEAAIATITQAILRRPGGARYHHSRGMIRIMQAHAAGSHAEMRRFFSQAVEDLSRAIELDSEFAKAWSQRGYAYLELEQYESALRDIDVAIDLEDGESVDYKNRAICRRQLGRFEQAEGDERRAASLGGSRGERASGPMPLDRGAHRAGDDSPAYEFWTEAVRLAAVRTLDRWGLMDEYRGHLASLLRGPLPSFVVRSATLALVRLDGWDELQVIADDDSAPPSSRSAAASRIAESGRGESGLSVLFDVACDVSRPADARIESANTVAERAPPESIVELLRRLPDIDQTREDPPLGTRLALHLFRAVARRPSGHPLIAALARDVHVEPELREMAAEVVGSSFDRADAQVLLRSLAQELAPTNPLQRLITNALRIFGERERADESAANPHQAAFEAFMRAGSAEDIDALSDRHPILRDPAFVGAIAAQIERLDLPDPARVQNMLDRLRSLSPDHSVIAVRLVTQADSSEALQKVVFRYPFVALATDHGRLEQLGERTLPPRLRLVFEHKLNWLREQSFSPEVAAVQAFAVADTDDALRLLIEQHPVVRHVRFVQAVRLMFALHPDGPAMVKRIETLRALAPDVVAASGTGARLRALAVLVAVVSTLLTLAWIFA